MKPHYGKIRKVKTHSGATAIQVGRYIGKRFQLAKHIGSSKDTRKVAELIGIANEYILTNSPQLELNFKPQSEEILFKRGIKVEKSTLSEAFEYLSQVYASIGFGTLSNDLLKHFAIIRVLEPASKARSILLLQKYFDISYKKTTVFRNLSELVNLKEEVVGIAIKYAKEKLQFDFSLVFYDVTTLYFETFNQDTDSIDEKGEVIKPGLRKPGFSKDNKPNQPQILIGLVVDQSGFPIYYDVFKDNTFEGKTIIPVIVSLKAKYQITKLTVVADAGMLSVSNLEELEKENIDYVVGGRIGNLKIDEVRSIAEELNKTDQRIIRIGEMLYEYSAKRAKKDKADNDKAINRADYYLKNPSKVLKRSKFLTQGGKKNFTLNESLIEKQRLLEGLKSYRTNITAVSKELLVARYKDLWKIEQSFRIAKSDLEARPIYHRLETSIKYHILIVFVALCMTRVIEKEKGVSIKQVTDELKDKWTITLKDEISGNSLSVVIDKKPH